MTENDFQRQKIKYTQYMLSMDIKFCHWCHGGGGGKRLIVGFQPLMVISPTASWIRWCMQVYWCHGLNSRSITHHGQQHKQDNRQPWVRRSIASACSEHLAWVAHRTLNLDADHIINLSTWAWYDHPPPPYISSGKIMWKGLISAMKTPRIRF